MIELRFHGRGGDGAVLGGKMLGVAASLEGKIAQIIPAYQATRRGGDVDIHLRISDEPISITSRVYSTDGIVVFNSMWEDKKEFYTTGLKEGGFAVINSRKKPTEIDLGVKVLDIGVVDATGIALETISRAIPNTAILGALCKTTGIVGLESLKKGVESALPSRLHENNIRALEKAYNETVVHKGGS